MDKEKENSKSTPIFHFMTHKAGMDAIDADKISQKVLEISKNSEFYKRQQEKKQKYDEKITEMLKTIENFNKDPSKLYLLDQQIEAELALFEKQRYLKKIWAHFDGGVNAKNRNFS